MKHMKKEKRNRRSHELIREMIELYHPQSIKDIQEMLKDMFADTMEEKLFRLFPERVSTLAVTSRVLHETGHKLQNVLFAVNVRKRIVSHRLFEIDRVQNLYPVTVSFKQLSGFANQAAFRVGYAV